MKRNLTRKEIRSALTGPFGSIRTPFTKDGSVDTKGLRNHVERNIENGAGTVLLTAGDSHFHILSDSEIAQVTRVTVEQTAGRALVVAADRYHSTSRAVDFARYVRDVGADVLMVLPPDWAASCTSRTLAEHYGAVAREIPVMVVTNLYGPRGIDFGLKTMQVLVEQVDGIVAVKDDVKGQFARRMCLLVHERWAVFSGGMKQNHLDLHPYGCDGYMSTYIAFHPQVARQYWSAIQDGNLDQAREVIKTCDMPLFDFLAKLQGGFDAGLHAMLEIYGIAGRWRRKPHYSLTDREMEILRDHLQGLGVL
jgi:4-hydroxy-tetrahydrodipicolinate synthase